VTSRGRAIIGAAAAVAALLATGGVSSADTSASAVRAASGRTEPAATKEPARVADAAKRPAVVEQLVVFRDGAAVAKRVTARQVSVRVGRRSCIAAAGTPLAALVRSRPGTLRLFDYGSCSAKPRDGAGLFVRAIRRDRNRGQDGWVYKVGNRVGTAGAADPSGPFGRGRLRSDARVTWFYCDQGPEGCQRTLGVRASAAAGGVLVRVTGYGDRGDGTPVEGATVHAGDATATTAADGSATLPLPSSVRVYAEKPGLVRSFDERVQSP
jgi:hypothetical protein